MEINETEKRVLSFYGLDPDPVDFRPHGHGHINDTYYVKTKKDGQTGEYILQKINTYVFRKPREMMDNIQLVTDHLRKKVIERGGDPEREVVRIIPAKNGQMYLDDPADGFWRLTPYISEARSYEIVEKPEDFHTCGQAWGQFQKDLADFPVQLLVETIPGFHDTMQRYEALEQAVHEDKLGRLKTCSKEAKFYLERKNAIAAFAGNKQKEGLLPTRVTHNDTKYNNLLIDDQTGKALCILDLDTLMPGLSMNDFGDAIRSGTNTAAEDEKDLSKVHCDLGLYKVFTDGFLEGCCGQLTKYEIDTLPMGAIGMTYEVGIRFLQDYLIGDPYFKTAYPEHNLVRSRTQMKMVQEMEDKWDQIQRILKEAEKDA